MTADHALAERDAKVGRKVGDLAAHDRLLEREHLIRGGGLPGESRAQRLPVHPLGLQADHRPAVLGRAHQQAVHVHRRAGHDDGQTGDRAEVSVEAHRVVDRAAAERVGGHTQHGREVGAAVGAPVEVAHVDEPVERVQGVVPELNLGQRHEVAVQPCTAAGAEDPSTCVLEPVPNAIQLAVGVCP